MHSIGVRELRQHASRYLAMVRAGESVEVTDRGVPVARLVPVPQDAGIDRLVRDGLVVPRVGSQTLPTPVARPGEPSTVELLDEMRVDRA